MIKKALYSIGGGVFLILIAGVVYLFTAFPSVDEAPELFIEGTPEQISCGQYLANNVSVCIDCHSERDWSRFPDPLFLPTVIIQSCPGKCIVA